jgi:hypothetical protein
MHTLSIDACTGDFQNEIEGPLQFDAALFVPETTRQTNQTRIPEKFLQFTTNRLFLRSNSSQR